MKIKISGFCMVYKMHNVLNELVFQNLNKRVAFSIHILHPCNQPITTGCNFMFL